MGVSGTGVGGGVVGSVGVGVGVTGAGVVGSVGDGIGEGSAEGWSLESGLVKINNKSAMLGATDGIGSSSVSSSILGSGCCGYSAHIFM